MKMRIGFKHDTEGSEEIELNHRPIILNYKESEISIYVDEEGLRVYADGRLILQPVASNHVFIPWSEK